MHLAACRAAIAATTAAAALLAACSAPAQSKDPALRTWEQNRFNELFNLVDSNDDGKVSHEEFQRNYAAVTWLYFDKNGDGIITVSEWAIDGTGHRRMEWFASLDTNGDQILTRKEFDRSMSPAGTTEFFKIMDKNGDGVITASDLQQS